MTKKCLFFIDYLPFYIKIVKNVVFLPQKTIICKKRTIFAPCKNNIA